jgi:branched-chain amino acid aminotransferase
MNQVKERQMDSISFPKFAFLDGQIVPWGEANIHISTIALHYGTGCFEGIRGYWNEKKGKMFIFRGKEHFQRLHRSCRIIFINLKYSTENLLTVTKNLILKNQFQENVYIRPVAYKKKHPNIIGPNLNGVSDGFFMMVIPRGISKRSEGIHLGSSSWRRLKDTAIPPRGKICGSYVNTGLARTESNMSGYDDAIFLTEEGYVSEAGTSNLVIVRGEILITPPPYMDILEGITLDTALTIAKDIGITISERPIHRSELFIADEVFICGTMSEIVAVTRIDHRPIGNGKVGPITKKIQDIFRQIVEASDEKYTDWLEPVT